MEGQTAAGGAHFMTAGQWLTSRGSAPGKDLQMVRTALLALALALFGGAPYTAIWAAVGNMADPNGVTTNAGSHFDPDGLSADSDAGSMSDPNG